MAILVEDTNALVLGYNYRKMARPMRAQSLEFASRIISSIEIRTLDLGGVVFASFEAIGVLIS